VALVLTVIATAALLVIAVIAGTKLSHRLFHLEIRSAATAKRVRKPVLMVWGYVALLLLLGFIAWGVTGSVLASVFTPAALMFFAPFIFQFARPSLERRLAKKRADRRSTDPQ